MPSTRAFQLGKRETRSSVRLIAMALISFFMGTR